MDIKNKISLYLTGIITIPMIIFVCALCGFMSIYLLEQKTENLISSSDNLAGYISSTYQDQIKGMQSITDNPVTKTYLENPNDPANQTAMYNVFFDTFNVFDNPAESTLLSPDGTVLISSTNNLVGTSLGEDILYQRVLELKNKEVILEFEENIPLLSIGYPIFKDNTLLGIYKRITPLNYITYYAENANSIEENVYVLTKFNRGIFYQTHGFEDDYGDVFQIDVDTQEDPEVKTIKNILTAELEDDSKPITGATEFSVDGLPSVGGYYIIEDMGWIVLISQPKAFMYSRLNEFQLIIIACSFVGIIILYYVVKSHLIDQIDPVLNYDTTLKQFLRGRPNVTCDTSRAGIFSDLGQNINTLFHEINDDKKDIYDMKKQLTELQTTDPVTGLNNNKALYNVIDQYFLEDENQALIMFNSGIYDDIDNTFGNSVSNRMLEIITQYIIDFRGDSIFPVRLSKDTFCFYINHYDDFLELRDMVRLLGLKLRSITHIDDLQVEMNPHIALVYKDENFLGRSDWLRVGISTLNEAVENDEEIRIYDKTDEEINITGKEYLSDLL